MKRRFLVTEVIQTSAMDCGPASLKALAGGFGRYLSYGRLREACQTDIDGTSIDMLEEVAHRLGLDVEQRMMPADLLLLGSSACVPAIVVVRLPDGATHFVVLWRVHGSYLQVMDPAGGRVWVHRRRFLASLYVHEQTVRRAAWDEWSRSAAFTAGLRQRMRDLGVTADLWADRAHQDAALRLGKSTLTSLLAGLRTPSAGVILADGLDRQTLGDATWRRRIAPQYHENHILSASLGFNLLLGRPFPHSARDLDDARAVCDELGLGPLLQRMPGGLDQMVGETGWQLSPGERSRVFLARALLQDADVVLLDESLGALDPESLQQCVECVMRRARTLLVVAHP
jgi:ABC-type bacteriocin/lantibiotic exporter with double-glycine peptidase domain